MGIQSQTRERARQSKMNPCECERAAGWVESEWLRPWCFQGRCYTAQNYTDCEDKDNGHQLGDGTKCIGGRRSTVCPTDIPLACPAGRRGPGGVCNCSLKPVTQTDGTKWALPWCYEGRCYTRQLSGPGANKCSERPGWGYQGPAGRGTWCRNGRRDTSCPTE